MNEWIKWYKSKTGSTWSNANADKSYSDALKGLSEKERKTAQLLYKSYVKQKDVLEDSVKNIDKIESDNDTALRQDALNAKNASFKVKEDLLARGQLDSVKLKEREESINDSLSKAIKQEKDSSAYMSAKTADDANAKILRQRQETNAEIGYKNAYYSAKEEKEYVKRLEAVKDILSENSINREDGVKYFASGKEKARDYILTYKDKLGDKYQDILDYVNSLPDYDHKIDGYRTIYTKYGEENVSNKDISFLDAVKYKEKAGWLVIDGETYVVEYQNVSYKLKSGKKTDKELNALLSSLAATKDIKKAAGTTLYYKDKLYVYTGVSDWREVGARNGKSGAEEYNALMTALRSKYDEK